MDLSQRVLLAELQATQQVKPKNEEVKLAPSRNQNGSKEVKYDSKRR